MGWGYQHHWLSQISFLHESVSSCPCPSWQAWLWSVPLTEWAPVLLCAGRARWGLGREQPDLSRSATELPQLLPKGKVPLEQSADSKQRGKVAGDWCLCGNLSSYWTGPPRVRKMKSMDAPCPRKCNLLVRAPQENSTQSPSPAHPKLLCRDSCRGAQEEEKSSS